MISVKKNEHFSLFFVKINLEKVFANVIDR